jgi:hypothetical protein
MEKFMLIRRLNAGSQASETSADDIHVMDEWIRSLRESGKYSSGGTFSMKSQYVSKDLVVADYSYNEMKEGISGYDVILPENLNEAISIARTCPLVMKGIALYEVRPIVPLIR